MDLVKISDKYISRQERLYNRNLKSLTKFLIRDFAEYATREMGLQYNIKKNAQLPQSPKLQGNNLKIAFICEEIGHLTGGRYYAWFVCLALCELGYDVTFYTNQQPTYFNEFKEYKLPKVEIVANRIALEDLDVYADLYISAPLHGNIGCARLAQKYNKPAYCMIFDPSPFMIEFLGYPYSGWEKAISVLKPADVQILSLCETTALYIPEWLNKRQDQIHPLYPCINSRELVKTRATVREDYVLYVSRIVKHKKFEDVLYAVKQAGVRLKVISSNDNVGSEKLIKKFGLQKKVEFFHKLSDFEKFNLMKGASAVISASVFEGFGMWAAEAVATGTPLVCYEFPTIREIEGNTGATNFYFAKYDQREDLAEKLKQCLEEKKFSEPSHFFDFDNLITRVKSIITPEPRIGVITIALNEEKFISASLSSVLKHKNIAKVAVVEGAVNLFSHAANDEGLSVDRTQDKVLQVMKKAGNKLIYERYGWASDKSELRNRALQLLGKNIDYVLIVDADEVYKQEDLDNLVQAMKDNPRTGVFLYSFYHFWKKSDTIAVGGQWNSQMFRCFKYEDKSLHWEHHGAPVVNGEGQFINVTDGSKVLDSVHVYHYGAMKDEKRILEKLEYYRKRDTNLKVKNTWSEWEPGKETQWTHGDGTAEPFTGSHPEEVRPFI